MDDLIYRKDIAERLERVVRYGVADKDGYHCVSAESVLETVNKLPSAVIKASRWPIIFSEKETGEWLKISPAGIYECSVCGQSVMTSDISCYKYCHGCGAWMESD